jgi:hypothetical protein
MVDTTGWTVRNKANPYFAKANHVKLAKNQATKRFIDSALGLTLAQFAEWFLASGAWDNDGRWFDVIPWDPAWFLATGRIDVLGAWSDSEAW